MYIEIESNNPTSLVSKIAISLDATRQIYSVRVYCIDLAQYHALKVAMGEVSYYDDEGNLDDRYSMRVKSSNTKLVMFFINKIIQLAPEFTSTALRLKNISSNPYQHERDIPDWDVLDERKYSIPVGDFENPMVNFNCLAYNGKTKTLRFLFEKHNKNKLQNVYIIFRSETIANEFLSKLCQIDNSFWSTKRGFDKCSFIHWMGENTSSVHCRLDQIMSAIISFDPAAGSNLIKRLNSFLITADEIRDLQPSQPLRFQIASPSNNLTPLTDKINVSKNNPEMLKKVLDELADLLIDKVDNNDIQMACKRIYELYENKNYLHETDRRFLLIFNGLYYVKNSNILNSDDLKYFLRTKHYYLEFINGTNEKYKKQHCEIAFALTRQFITLNVSDLMDNKLDEINSLRTQLIKRKPNSLCEEGRTNLALLILSKYWPLNEEDPITLEKIDPKRRVFTTSGHQFDMPILFENHASRDVRYKANGVNFETANNKKFLNPIPNTEFSAYDKCHIHAIYHPDHPSMEYRNLEALYDYLVINTTDALEDIIYGGGSYPFEIPLERIAQLEETIKNRLIQNILKHDNSTIRRHYLSSNNTFSNNLHALLTRGLSIERFAHFDNAKQEALVLNEITWHLIDYKIDPEMLYDLSSQQLETLFQKMNSDNMRLMRNLSSQISGAVDEVNAVISDLGTKETKQSRKQCIDYVD